jgi:glycosyltransferase involved in cell wall biosynthesis
MRADLHVHSSASRHPSHWVLQRLGCNECYTEPERLYDLARERGMDLVTITDHNSIEGCLRIADRPGAFLGEEITAYFPEDRCKVHVLAYDLTEEHHRDIQQVRENVHDLVAYLRDAGIVHALAHPMYPVNGKLTLDHIEQLLLLFKVLELGGDEADEVNDCLQAVARSLTPAWIERLANRHDLEPTHPRPWQKSFISGSDDHSSLYIARCYTEVPEAGGVQDLLEAIDDGRTQPVFESASPRIQAHAMYGVAYQFYRERFARLRPGRGDLLTGILDRFLVARPERQRQRPSRLRLALGRWRRPRDPAPGEAPGLDLIRREAERLILDDPTFIDQLRTMMERDDLHNAWFQVASRVTNRSQHLLSNHVLDSFTGGNVFELFHSLGAAGALYFSLTPYFVSFTMQARHRRFSRQVRARFQELLPRSQSASPHVRVAHFTDTFREINGVALTLQQQVRAARRQGKDYTVVTCYPSEERREAGTRNFTPVGVYELPEYPELELHYPPFLEMLDWCYHRDVSVIHAATPGPMGAAALAIGSILQLPVVGTYHTALPQYGSYLTDEGFVEDTLWQYMIWFYTRLHLVLAPSRATARELEDRGVPGQLIHTYPRGIDVERFHPRRRDPALETRLGLDGRRVLLYVGRVSREKNLPLLVRVFTRLSRQLEDLSLVVVGDGPYRPEMQRRLQGTPAIFTGCVLGDELPALYAAADLFVFPSTTDTFGNAVLEAQACGIPVVVTDRGGPGENLDDGASGVVVPGGDEDALLQTLLELLDDLPRLQEMGRRARARLEDSSFERAFEQSWHLYESLLRQREAPAGSPLHGEQVLDMIQLLPRQAPGREGEPVTLGVEQAVP